MEIRETLQALLDGKTIRNKLGVSYKIMDGRLVLRYEDGKWMDFMRYETWVIE